MKKIIALLIVALTLTATVSCGLRDVGGAGSVTYLTEAEETASAPPAVESETEPFTEPASETETSAEPVTEPVTEQATENTPPVEGAYKPKAMMYHLILETPLNSLEALYVRPSTFERQLEILTEKGYAFQTAEEWHMGDRPTVILTFDDGYADNYTNMFPLLKKYNARATVFLITGLVGTSGYLTVDQIREMSASGLVSFQSHLVHHVDLAYQDEATIRSEFSESKRQIEEWTGKPVRALAYPAGSYNDLVLSVASEFFDFAYTTRSPYNYPDFTPLTVSRYYMAREMTENEFQYLISYN